MSEVEAIDALAQEIRRVDGNHDLGAGALAEVLTPFIAAREAAARAEALREAADALYLSRPGQHNEGAKNWLHRRANLIDPRTRGSVCEHGYSRSVGCDYCDYCDDTASIARTDGAGS